jgi:3',5'-nucleoside bisphosphate phosphatase
MLIEMHALTLEHSRCSTVGAAELVRQVYSKRPKGIVFTNYHYLWYDGRLKSVHRSAAVPEHFLLM